MIFKIALSLVGVLVFIFIMWKRLREDYGDTTVFTSSFYIIFGILAGVLFSLYFNHEWWFWSGLAGSFVGYAASIIKFKLRAFEVLEPNVLGIMVLLGLVFIYDYIERGDLPSAAGFFVLVLLFVLFAVLNRHYKNFSWYKSGRIGFSGLAILGLFFLIRAAVAVFSFNVISFVGKGPEVILSGVLAFGSFLLLFNISEVKS